jgi:tetratricopeptide (TPR) repeat protein
MIAATVCNTYIELGVNAYRQGYRDVGDKMLEAAFDEAQRLITRDAPADSVFNKLAYLYYQQKDFDKAENVYRQALDLYGKLFNEDNESVGGVMYNLAELYFSLRKYDDAAPLYEGSLGIDERRLGKEHPTLERRLLKLAWIYCTQERYDDAHKLYNRVRNIREEKLALLRGTKGEMALNYAV